MAGFRKNFKRIASKGAGVLPTSFLQKVSNQLLILPFYHAISDAEMPHVKHLYAVKGVWAFTKDLDFLLKHYTPIGYNQFLEITSSQRRPQEFFR
jgi:hypothetical protein